MSSSIFWFYISSLFFPARSLHYSQMTFQQFLETSLPSLSTSYGASQTSRASVT